MRSDEFDAFAGVIRDLCAAYDRPATDDRVRVFWETLKHLQLLDVKRAAEAHRRSSKKFPTPRDLMPERPRAPPRPTAESLERWSSWAMAANKILFACCFQAERGFKPVGPYPPMPKEGYCQNWRAQVPQCVDDTWQRELFAAKRDYVRMAEADEAKGEKWDTTEFNRMCREGFQTIIARADAAQPRQ